MYYNLDDLKTNLQVYLHRQELDTSQDAWLTFSGENHATVDTSITRRKEALRWHALENHGKDLKCVQDLERRLGISVRWKPGDVEWQHARRLVANREYQQALDRLEGLVVAWIFELSKMNRAGTGKFLFLELATYTHCDTGYKLRKHITKALQAWSVAIRTALDCYNTAACVMRPPRCELHWDEVVEYAFLLEFDLLRDS